jgi:hypothetical protein
MTTEAQNVKFRQQMKKEEASTQTPAKAKMLRREKIRIRRRCKLCGRGTGRVSQVRHLPYLFP